MKNTNKTKCSIYLITPNNFELDRHYKTLEKLLEMDIVTSLQLRLKNANCDQIKTIIKEVFPLCVRKNVVFILNDYPRIATETGVHGVHIGREDTPLETTREIISKSMIVGVSCYNSLHQAMLASENGADYVAFGSFYETKTKTYTVKADLSLIKNWTKITDIPAVAIGGIRPDNCEPIIQAGADFLAVCSSVWNSKDDPIKVIDAFSKIIKKNEIAS